MIMILAERTVPRRLADSRDVGDLGPAAAAAVAPAVPAYLVRRGAGGPAGGEHQDGPQRRRAAAHPRLPGGLDAAIRDHEQLRFDYVAHDGDATTRRTEPHRLVYTGRRWYLLAWDTDRRDWRPFRADRIRPRFPTGPRFTPREPPEDPVAHVVLGVAFDVLDPPELRALLRDLAARYAAAANQP